MYDLLSNTKETVNMTRDIGPMVSILIYNYDGRMIEACLDSILHQQQIRNFEVVICDDASSDGAWGVATHYARIHSGKLTISRNNTCMGKRFSKRKGYQLCKGEYCVELTATDQFDPTYIKEVITSLKTDKFIQHAYINRLKRTNHFLPPYSPIQVLPEHAHSPHPFVSICIYNYNYGRYLRQCLESVFNQTYGNIEVCFSDNASSDDSWDIAMEFAEMYPGRISLTRNRANFGPNVNLYNCTLNIHGKYLLKLTSDDALQPNFIERCVSVLEAHPEAAFAMVHRDIMDADDKCIPEAPFYDQSCLIQGAEKAAVYMMSSVNPSISQIVYNIDKTEGKRMAGNLNDRWFGDRIMDFHICCDYPMIYIKEPLLLNRVHQGSDSSPLEDNLLQCMGEYVLLHQLADIAGNHEHMQSACERLQPAINKLGSLCLRYCLRCLLRGDDFGAGRYLHLSAAIFPEICADSTYLELTRYFASGPQAREEVLDGLKCKANLTTRTVSYPPPPGSIPC